MRLRFLVWVAGRAALKKGGLGKGKGGKEEESPPGRVLRGVCGIHSECCSSCGLHDSHFTKSCQSNSLVGLQPRRFQSWNLPTIL